MIKKTFIFAFFLFISCDVCYSQTDTIEIKETFWGTYFKVDGKLKNTPRLSKILKQTPEADVYRKRGVVLHFAITPFSFVGGGLFYIGLKQVVYGYNRGWVHLGISALSITGGVLFERASKNNLKKAVLIHNKQINISEEKTIKKEFFLSGNGIGLRIYLN
ncbi:MAG: hypothetical protein ACLGGV_05740 [Bacteroidia bacterium]